MATSASRRRFLGRLLALGGAAGLPRFTVAAAAPEDDFDYLLTAEAADVELVPGTTSPGLTFSGEAPGPVLHTRQGRRLRVKLVNRLDLPTTIHWHGIRIDNAMDGVPWITQRPVMPGEAFTYDFVPPDAGTFWYHPHIYSIEQLSRGMVGMLIVGEREPPDFDADIPLGLKKWRLRPDGSFLRLSIPRQAARMGTPGTYQTVNHAHQPEVAVPAGGRVRLRFANLDNTISYALGVGHDSARYLAFDGMPLDPPRAPHDYPLGPGMRLDIGLLTPRESDVEIPVHHLQRRRREPLLTLRTEGPSRSRAAPLEALPANPLPVPDPGDAELKRFTFDWSGVIAPDEEAHPSFWAINRKPWPGAAEGDVPPPIATLEHGRSYVFELKNTAQYSHPIHLHGLIFTVLASDKRDIRPHQADTVMLDAYETVRIALVADNRGRWMFHCHVIEHMKTGLMAYVEIR